MKKINLGIIGVGYWGPNYARLCFELEQANLVWCADINKESLVKVRQKWPTVKTTTSYGDILRDPAVSAVIVVTPAQTHFKIVKDALLAGKDVLVEKPLTAKLEEAKRIKQLVKKTKRILMVDHVFKFNPAIKRLKELVDKGELGKIYYISASYTALGPIRKDVDALWDLAPHWVYVLNYLLDSKPSRVTARGGDYLKPGMNDVVFITLDYPKKVLADLHISWLYPQKVRSLAIVGDKKMVVFDDVAPEAKLTIYDKGAKWNSGDPNFANLQVIFRDGDVVIPKIEAKEPLKEGLIHFLECINEKKESLVNVDEGVEVVGILEMIRSSMGKKG